MLLSLEQNGDDAFSRDALDDRTKKAETWHRDAAARVQYSRPAQPITCATYAQDVLEGRASVSQGHEHKHQPLIFGPASLVNGALSTERERMIAQVFQPSHRMPTMSIEDAGLTEMSIMNDWQEQTKKAIEEATTSWHNDKPFRKKEEDEEDDDEDEEAVMKARAFDDWKDDNPRGAGLHVGLTMFTGYLVGYASFRALFNRNPALSAAGGILGLVLAMLVETLLFIIKTSKDDHVQSSKSFTPTTKKNQ